MNDIASAAVAEAPAGIVLAQALRIADIHTSPTNPRQTFPEAKMAEMIESVKRHGVMQPVLVRPWPAAYTFEGEQPKYELIAGERRYRAAKAAGLEFIGATVRELDDHETLELQIVENLHREDLNELEEAEGYELMIKKYGYSAERLAEKIDKSKAYIYARLKLTAACTAARTAFRDGQLDASRLLLVARIPTAGLQEKALGELLSWERLSTYRAAALHIQEHYMLKLAQAPFARGDAGLVPAAGKCHPCPKRTGCNPELYPDVKSADICTDPECYAAKKAAHFTQVKTAAKATGKALIDGAAAEKLLRNGDWNIAGFHKLDDKCHDAKYDDDKKSYPTYRELLGDQVSIPITLIEKKDGTLIEAVDEKAFKQVAANVGAKTKEISRDQDKERLAKEKAENEFRRRLFDQVRGAYAEAFTETGDVLDQEDIRLIARQFLSCLWHEYQKRLAMLWVPSEEKIDAHERIRTMTAMLDTMTQSELNRFLIDLALIGMSHVSGYGQTETPAPFLATAQRMLISPDTIRREIKAEQEAKGKGGKKAAKTEAPAAPPEPEQPAPAETQPETVPANAAEFKIGDHVVTVQGADEDLQADQIGKTGEVIQVINSIVRDESVYAIRFDDGSEEITAYADELVLLPPAAEKTATADTPWPTTTDIKAGDRVRVKSDNLRSWRRTYAGKEGIVHHIDLDECDAHVGFDVGGEDRTETFFFDEIELLAAAEMQPETANTEQQTYQAGDRVHYADEGTPEADAIATVQAIHENGNIEILSHSGKHKLIGAWAADRWMNPAPLEAEQAPAEEPKPDARKTTAKVEILYSHPENADLAWTGRGRKPKWVEHWLKTGTLEQLLAKKRPKHKPKTSKAIATSAACEISTPRCDKTLELPGVTVTDSQPSA